jgi:hypothetical protein
MSERDDFLKAQKEFEKRLEFVERIFRAVGRLKVEPRRAWANLLFFRLAVTGGSLLLLCIPELRDEKREPGDVSVLDHVSIAAVGRSMLETSAMFLYLTHPTLSDEEWQLRRDVLELHDCTIRYRVLKPFGDEALEERDKIEQRRAKIASNPLFGKLHPEHRKNILDGKVLYVVGLRGALKEAGFDIDHFDAVYTSLSSFTHSHPASFYRSVLRPGEPEPGTPADVKYAVSTLIFDYLDKALGLTCDRMFHHLYPEIFLKGETKH